MNELAILIRLAVAERLRQVNTCLPGRIVSYDAAKQTATVQPLLKSKNPDGEVETLPPLVNVPVVFPRAGGAAITFPVAKGDGVMLSFSQRSIDEWRGEGGEHVVDDPRMLDLSDAIATPGLVDAKSGGGPTDCVEIKMGGASIQIRGGEIKITAGDIKLVGDLLVQGDVRVEGAIEATGDIEGHVP